MDATTKNTLAVLGHRIRKARLEHGMTQEVLAGPEFTKGYVSALERGAVRPSLKALDVFSRRLNIPIADFLVMRLETDTPPEVDALQEELTYRFHYARMLIRHNDTGEALKLLEESESLAMPHMEKLSGRIKYRIPFLRGLAHLQRAESDQARSELEQALEIAQKEGDPEVVATVRNMLGVAHLQHGQPQLALENHTQCLAALRRGEVRDLNLKLSIYRNVANDHYAMNDAAKAAEIYREALKSLEGSEDLHRQAEALWELATTERAGGDWARAKLRATRALHLAEAADSRSEIAAINMGLADLLSAEGRDADVRDLLGKAEQLLTGSGDYALLSNLYHSHANLARQRGDLEQAARYAGQSISLSEAYRKEAEKAKVNKQARQAALRTYADALQVAALIAEERGDSAEADKLFHQALDTIGKTSYDDVIYSITFNYAGVLERRGSHKEAMEYYRRAAQSHIRG